MLRDNLLRWDGGRVGGRLYPPIKNKKIHPIKCMYIRLATLLFPVVGHKIKRIGYLKWLLIVPLSLFKHLVQVPCSQLFLGKRPLFTLRL